MFLFSISLLFWKYKQMLLLASSREVTEHHMHVLALRYICIFNVSRLTKPQASYLGLVWREIPRFTAMLSDWCGIAIACHSQLMPFIIIHLTYRISTLIVLCGGQLGSHFMIRLPRKNLFLPPCNTYYHNHILIDCVPLCRAIHCHPLYCSYAVFARIDGN